MSIDWPKVESLFTEAVELPSEQLACWLEMRCGEDLKLRAELEAMLEADQVLNGLDRSPFFRAESWVPPAAPDLSGSSVGFYDLELCVGRGGMGTVYRARDRRPGSDGAVVAFKVFNRSLGRDDLVARFHNEAKVQQRLDHPHICSFIEQGVIEQGGTDGGFPFIVMEYVDGVGLLDYCDQENLDTDGKIRLFLQLCSAVQHCHERGVVHRDLKPGNILVDSDGCVRLLDFGIAKSVQPTGPEHHTQLEFAVETQVGERMMTPRYASPEQVTAQPITASSDVYSLGVLLFEMLVGRLPYRLRTSRSSELEEAIVELEPQVPSDALARPSGSASGHDGRLAVLRAGVSPSDLRGNLDAVVLQALQKSPGRRYATVADLGHDLERHLQGRRVEARRAELRRAGRLIRGRMRRDPLSLALLLLCAFLSLRLWQVESASSRPETVTVASPEAAVQVASAPWTGPAHGR